MTRSDVQPDHPDVQPDVQHKRIIERNYRKTVITGLQFTGVITGVITGGV